MANIAGGRVPGAQQPLTDADMQTVATDELDKLLEKAKEEQWPAWPAPLMYCAPPPPDRPAEGKRQVLKTDGEAPSAFVLHRRCAAEGERLPAVAESKAAPLNAGQRVTPTPERQHAAAPPRHHAHAVPPRQHLAPQPITPLPPIAASVQPRQPDEPRRENVQGVPLVKGGSEMPARQYEAPPAPRQLKQSFVSDLPAALPATKTEGEGQSRISYAFRSWGNEHRVELTSLRRDHQPLTVLLTPSDSLVNRRLQEEVTGQPQDINLLLHDGNTGDQQRQRQHGEEPADAEDEI